MIDVLRDVYLDGRMMGRAASWDEAADLLAASGHPALAAGIVSGDRISFGDTPTAFFVRSRKEGGHAA